jgi:putative transposase
MLKNEEDYVNCRLAIIVKYKKGKRGKKGREYYIYVINKIKINIEQIHSCYLKISGREFKASLKIALMWWKRCVFSLQKC